MHHLASWGFIAITPQLKNYGEWTQNAVRLKNMVHLIATWPNLISNRVRPNKIILVGHSFGGSAVSLAAAKGAQVKGLVLLDPPLAQTLAR
jgi:pimeloyl-ACP methyl ester carboxylesterase